MMRSPLERKREDETPISPSPSSPVPEIFSTKKIFFLNSSFSGSRHSEIPHVESDYCPRDETSRRLFVQNEELCDCDCSSDGCWGCLRRNKKCLCKIFVFVLFLLILVLLFGWLTYNFSRSKESQDLLGPDLKNKLLSHYHNYNSVELDQYSNAEKDLQMEKDLFEDDYSTFDDYDLNENIKTQYYKLGYSDEKKLPQEIIPYFANDWNVSYDDFQNNIRTISDDREPPRKKRSITSRKKKGIFVNDMNYDERKKPFAVLKFQERTIWDEFEQKRKFQQEHLFKKGKTIFHPFSLTTPMHSTPIQNEDYYDEVDSVEEDESSKFPLKLEINTEDLNLSAGLEKDQYTKYLGSEKEVACMDDKAEISSEMTNGDQKFFEETKIDRTTISPKLSLIDFKEKTKQGVDFFVDEYYTITDTPMTEKNVPFYFGGIEGINLEEAKKRMKGSKKHLLLNSRVVAGSPDVTLPTGPDVGKPVPNSLETMKINQQYSLTPSAASQFIFPYQICLFANPHLGPKPSIRSAQTRTFSLENPFLISSHVNKEDSDKLSPPFSSQQNFLSFSVNNYANPPFRQQAPYSASGSSSFNFPYQYQQFPQYMNNAPPPNTQPIFCTYIQPPLFQFPSVSGTSDFRHSECVNCGEKSVYHPVEEKINISGQINFCSGDNVSCRDGSACIPTKNWCDNEVHCQDVSDEEFCSCRDRVAIERLCDGYIDCPLGEDEVGCFDCPQSAFSCASIINPDSCIPLNKKCDGVRDCVAGTDEDDCTALFFNIGNQKDAYKVAHLKGFLHHNWKGIWYPVCVDLKNDDWAKEACFGETGYSSSEVEVLLHPVPNNYKGQFLMRDENEKVTVQDHCKGHYSTYVKCPSIKCGTRAEFYSLQEFENRFKRFSPKNLQEKDAFTFSNDKLFEKNSKLLNNTFKLNNKTKKETGRVVGGKESEPRAWPWAIAVYEDGNFHCGGVILDEKWVLTAAHCVEGYWKHFYEVRGGMLRRFSFSAMEQSKTVADIIVHENYNPAIMSNDIALLHLKDPFHMNRWVRPACLPSFRGNYFESILGPHPGTRCIAVGWGATRERGSDADQLREVEVPILKYCKHKEDLVGAEICAGQVEGGKDTCQGDSGGPLLCRDSKTPASWYVAGIVSHGEGCARPGEPGAYTRIGLFVDWITANTNEFLLPSTKPLKYCPGYRCKTGTKLCIPNKWVCNGFTDCLSAEDEKNCTSTRTISDNFYNIYAKDLKSVKTEEKLNLTNSSDASKWSDLKNNKTFFEIIGVKNKENVKLIEDIKNENLNNEKNNSNYGSAVKLNTSTEKILPEKVLQKSTDIELTKLDTTLPTSTYTFVANKKILSPVDIPKSNSETLPSLKTTKFSHHFFHEMEELKTSTQMTPFLETATSSSIVLQEATVIKKSFEDADFLETTDHLEEKKTEADEFIDLEIKQAETVTQDVQSDAPAFENFYNDPTVSSTSLLKAFKNENIFDQVTKMHSKKPEENKPEFEVLNTTPSDYTSDFISDEVIVEKNSKQFTVKSESTNYNFFQYSSTSDSISASTSTFSPLATISSYNSSDYFQCFEIVQSILKIFRCDGIRDCEDGSDEENCTCAEILMKENPQLICDEQIDCNDLSDEKNCQKNSRKNIVNLTNKACLPSFMKCEGVCSNSNTTECYLLVTKRKLLFNNDEPLLQNSGLLLKKINNEISPVCQENESLEGGLAATICLDLGYIGYFSYKNKTVSKNCTGLHITCSKSLISSVKFYRSHKENYFWPWNAVIFADGQAICSGVLLFPQWVLTSQFCFHNISIEKSYIAAKLGARSLLKPQRDFGSQFLRIDAFRFLSNSDLALLHLNEKANETWHVRPIGFPYVFESNPETDICIPSGVENMFLKILEECPIHSFCYNRTVPLSIGCASKPSIGVIVCQSKFGWYPSSTFVEQEGRCGFTNSKFNVVEEHLKQIYSVTEEKIVGTSEPFCDGFRCPEGLCISNRSVCDGIFDCLSREDESLNTCFLSTAKYEQCKKTELKCSNGKCISKVLFANGEDDCGDGSDEPANATCVEYLRLTAPHKICNGKRNCLDKTDENYQLCGCDSNKFKCRLSNNCIPNDFVCDGEKDCPDGEDENVCSGRKIVKNSKTKAVEIVKKSYGLWHTMCPVNLSKVQSDALCRHLGFEKASLFYEKRQSVVLPRLDPFSIVKLNSFTSIALRSDRPLVKLVKTRRLCSIVKCI